MYGQHEGRPRNGEPVNQFLPDPWRFPPSHNFRLNGFDSFGILPNAIPPLAGEGQDIGPGVILR